MPDRYADAVRARRTELRTAQALLDGTHRTELRSELALSRVAAAEAAAAAFARLAAEARRHADTAGRAGRRELPRLLADATAALTASLHAGWVAELAPALRRIATTRALDLDPSWPRLPGPGRPGPAAAVPDPVRGGLLAGAVDGLALWRLVLVPLALLPLLGLPALGGPALLPLAVGAGAAGVTVAVRSRRTALERAALRRCAEESLAAARSALDADLARLLLELERPAVAELDRAVARRRAAVTAELHALAPVEVSRA